MEELKKIKVLGAELEYDPMDVEAMEAFENSLERIIALQDEFLGQKKPNKLSEGMRIICYAVFDVFDGTFGEGASKQVFGDSINMRQALQALADVTAEIQKAQTTGLAEVISKYTPKRDLKK